MSIKYIIAMCIVYGCAAVICLLAIVFGLRARANVKRERVKSLAAGFSPLDVQRIFIGKTYPCRLTRALIVHWAQMGYIRVEYVSYFKVRLVKLRMPALHDKPKAVFFDRGTYVRERDLFNLVFGKEKEKTVNILRPLFGYFKIKEMRDTYAVREDAGVYSALHYRLKILTFALSVIPFFAAAILGGEGEEMIAGIIAPLIMCLGMFVFRFMLEIPFLFRFVWSSVWVAAGSALLIYEYARLYDPALLGIAAVVILFVGSFVLVRFVDHRERNNLDDYSDLTNYKKHLIYAGKSTLSSYDAYAALPFIYAFNIKWLVWRKFDKSKLPDWFFTKNGKRGGLL